MHLNRNLRRNSKGIGTVFAMVFFLLIVMLVFASFMIILNQNTSLEQIVTQNRQIDNDRAREQITISPQPTTSLYSNVATGSVTVNCVVNNTGNLPVQFVRLWVLDLNNSESGFLAISTVEGAFEQGQAKNFVGTVSLTVDSPATDQFRFWFVTARGNQFTLGSNGGVQSQADFNQQLSGVLGDFLVDYHSVQWASVTTTNGVSVTGPWQSGWIIPTGSNNQNLAFRLNATYYGNSMMRIDNDTNILFKNLQDNSIVFEGASYNYATDRGVYPTLFISNYDKATSTLSKYNGHEISVDFSAHPTPITFYFSTIQQFTSDWPNAEGRVYAIGSPTPIGYPISGIQPNAMMTLSLFGMSPSTYAQSYPLFAVQSRPISIQLSSTSGPVGTLVTVTGTKFEASSGSTNTYITLSFDSTQITIPSTKTASTGNFGPVSFNVPPSAAGDNTVTATDSSPSNNAATAFFTVTPKITSITPTTGVSGTLITISGQGFAANSNLMVTFDGSAVVPPATNAITDATGSRSNLIFTAQSCSTPGTKIVNVTDARGNFDTVTFNLLCTPMVPAPTLNPLSPITLGTSATASVTVSGVAGFTPTGTVTFQVSTNSGSTWSTLGAVKTLVSGSATSDSYIPQALGSFYQFRAVYSGDVYYDGPISGAASGTLTVNKGTVSVSASSFVPASPITLGGSVMVSASVSAPSGITTAPTGSVQFQVSINGGAYANFGSAVALSSGSSSVAYTPQTATTYAFLAVYQGDTNYVSGTSGAASGILTVNKGTVSVSASSFVPASPITLGGSVMVSASVSAPSGITTDPSGSMQFMVKVGAGSFVNTGSPVALSGGSASISYTPLSIGTFSFQAVYQGDNNYNFGTTGAASGILTVYIATSTGTALSASSPLTLGGTTTDTATVTPQSYVYNQVTFVAAGAGISGTGASLSVAYPAGLATNDLLLLQTTVRDVINAPTTPAGWTIVYGADSSTVGRQWVYYKFASGAESGSLAVTFAGTNLKVAKMYDFRNVAASSFNEGGGFGTNSGTTISAQSVTTTGVNRLAVSFVFDTANNALNVFSGGTWAEPVAEYTIATGSGGGVQLQTATMPSAGTISGGSYTITTSASWGVRAFALIPTAIRPTGNVNFQVLAPGGSWTTFNSQTLTSGTATSASYKPTDVGTCYFRAIYAGDSNYMGSQSNDGDEPLVISTTTATVGAASFTPSSPIGLGTSETVSATVAGPSGVTAPTGTVQFMIKIGAGSFTNFGSPVALSSGSASISYLAQTLTTYQFQATYLGDTNYVSGTTGAASGTLTVNKGAAIVSASSFVPASPITLGGSVMVSASVSAPSGITTAPTGSVQFQVSINGGAYANFGSAVALSSGSSSVAYTPQTATTYAFLAVYQGDTNYNSGTGAASGTLAVNKATATVGAASFAPSSPITLGTAETVSASLTGPVGVTVPSGSVQFQVSINGGAYTNFGSLAALSGGSASISYTPLAATTHTFRAAYQGDSNYNSGTIGAASGALIVNKGTATVNAPTLSPMSPIDLGTSVNALVTVSGVAGVTPTGAVTFYVSTDSGSTWNPLGSVKTLSSGSATSDLYTPNALGSNYRIRAIYNGDGNYDGPVTGASASLIVQYSPHYIDWPDAVHDIPPVGTHSSFPAMQVGPDGVYDTLTEANTIPTTTTMGTTTDTGTSYTTINLNRLAGQAFTAPANAISVARITFYGRTSAGTFNVKAIITDGSGNILPNGVSNVVSCSTTAQSRTATFSTPPTITPGSNYWILIISQTSSFRLYYVGTTGGTSKADTTNNYATPTNPTDATSGTINYRAFYATVNRANYQLDQEVQFSSVTNFASYTQLQIQTGTFSSPAETILVDYWNGVSWINLGTLTASGLNTFTVSLTSNAYELRFREGTATNDYVQSSWQIDSVVLIAP